MKEKSFKEQLQKIFNNKEVFYKVHVSKIHSFIEKVKKVVLFDYYQFEENINFDYLYDEIGSELRLITSSYNLSNIENDFFSSLVEIRILLDSSIKEIYDGDPAANSFAEIVLSYPGFKAIFYYRLANFFYKHKLLSIARIISEEAHFQTGIDINPGATIGSGFFIDHGTGIVIGETAIIGDYVKLYQGVTLGALSLKDGHKLKDIKRHPTIKDNVTIYSNASILGGETIIGKNCTIGSNIYLTKSLEDNTVIYFSEEGIKTYKKAK